jgi:hypothetical protein
MGVGGSQKTKSTVRYKIPLFDTGGRAVEVTAYATDHITAPLEAADSTWMRAVFPQVPTGGIEAASGRVDLLIGLDNGRLFPVEHSRVQDAMLQRSRFGTGWIASGRPTGQGDPATSAEAATGAEETASAEATTGEEEAASAEATTGEEEAASAEAATSAEEAGSAEATRDKPAKPPDRLEGQSAVSSAVCVQDPDEAEEQEEPGDREELEECWRQDEDLFWDREPPGEEEEYGRLDEDLSWDEERIGQAAVVKRTPNTSPDKPCQQLGHMLAWKWQKS